MMGNRVLVLGLSMLVGGIKYKQQVFSKDVASVHTGMLILAGIGILTPSLFVHAMPNVVETADNPRVENLSLWISGLLIALYLGSLWFSLHSPQDMFRGGEAEESAPPVW